MYLVYTWRRLWVSLDRPCSRDTLRVRGWLALMKHPDFSTLRIDGEAARKTDSVQPAHKRLTGQQAGEQPSASSQPQPPQPASHQTSALDVLLAGWLFMYLLIRRLEVS